METRGIIGALQMTKFGLSSQLKRLELVSQNIAHVDRYPDENGQVYRRQSLEINDGPDALNQRFGEQLGMKLRRSRAEHISGTPGLRPLADNGYPEEDYFKIVEQNNVKLVYEPNHPQADADGYVRMPDINLVEEMVDLMASSRLYEANVTVMNSAKQIAKKSMEL